MVLRICLIFGLLALLSSCKSENTRPNLKFEAETFGCGDFMVYRLNKKNTSALLVIGDANSLNLTDEKQTFDIRAWSENQLQVRVDRYSENASQYFCNDVIKNPGSKISSWHAKEGDVRIRRTDYTVTNEGDTIGYRLLISIQNMLFENENGRQFEIEYEEFTEVGVGWLPG
jgi:hypothetical protein